MIKSCVFRPQSGQTPAVWGLARGGWLGKRTRSAQAAHRVVGAAPWLLQLAARAGPAQVGWQLVPQLQPLRTGSPVKKLKIMKESSTPKLPA